MPKLFLHGLIALCSMAGLRGATLRQLSLDDMVRQSSIIVRGKPQLTFVGRNGGSMIYTHYQIQVTGTLKGTNAAQLDVAVPGGALNGLRQARHL